MGYQDGPPAQAEFPDVRLQYHAISCGRAFIADPFLYRHLRDGVTGPTCVFCNACVGRIGSQGLDCFHPRVRAEKDAMLAAEQAALLWRGAQ
jgi:hypothetical protein